MRTRNLIKNSDLMRSDQIRSNDQVTGQEIWPTSVKSHSKFARILMAFRSNLHRMWIEFRSISMQFEAIWVSGASEIDRKSVPVPSLGTPGRPKECPGHPRAPQGVLRNHILIEIRPIANQIWSKLDRLWCEISTEWDRSELPSKFEQFWTNLDRSVIEIWSNLAPNWIGSRPQARNGASIELRSNFDWILIEIRTLSSNPEHARRTAPVSKNRGSAERIGQATSWTQFNKFRLKLDRN